ncbi:unnamed protein product [Coregonus sp. 'balchen']|nr:unnamed protein product [Coregonus sp. 'balchen']
MAAVAHQFGILIDEDGECQSARTMADEITRNITDTIKLKDEQLPLQGEIWKELSQLEKERCRLRKAGDADIEHYKSSLKKKEEELRKKQHKCDMSDAMASFILGMSKSGPERSYFLKWMRINLDNLSRQNLSGLRDRGPKGTGKSTLLNTMFGVQFAVSSGRCTRGAFMLLIKVNKGTQGGTEM